MINALCLQGGGIKGLAQASILRRLEHIAGKPVYKMFQVIAGTSTGAIQAMALSLGVPAEDIEIFYLGRGGRVFAPRFLSWGLMRAKYDIKVLRRELDIIYDRALFGACKIHTMIPATDVLTRKSVLFRSWDADVSGVSAADVVASSSAAPYYFDPYTIEPVDSGFMGGTYVDGGLFANNPSGLALVEIQNMWKGEPVRMVSVGCPVHTVPAVTWYERKFLSRGLVGALRGFVDLCLDSGMDATDYHCRTNLGKNYLVVAPQIDLADQALDNTQRYNLEALSTAPGLSRLAEQIVKFVS